MRGKNYKEYRDANNISHIININKKMRATFEVWQTNYTTTIFYPETGYKHKFVLRDLHKSVFFLFAKMKKQISENAKKEFWTMNFEKDLNLFDCSPKEKWSKKIVNIDLKNAYPTALFRANLIDAEMFEYIGKFNKLARLQSIGMFASRKTVFDYLQGYLIDITQTESETKNAYFFAANATDKIMKAAKNICGDSFLFYWFDGIYFEPKKEVLSNLNDFFLSHHIDAKTELITDLKVFNKKMSSNIIYTDSKGEKKEFNIPHPQEQVRQDNKIILNNLN